MRDGITIIAEHDSGRVKPVTYELVAFTQKLTQITPLSTDVLILGAEVQNLAREIADSSGLDVTGFEIPDMPVYNSELYNRVLTEHFSNASPTYVCIAHTSRGLDFAPALAVELDSACISGIEDVLPSEESICFTRPLYGGKVIAHVRPISKTSILTIQPGLFKPAGQTDPKSGKIDIKTVKIKPQRVRSLGVKNLATNTASITEADVIVAAGQGIGDKKNIDLVQQLASIFTKSSVAGSRIICDLGWLEFGCQIGVTGTTVSPRLYIACGISGAIQHITGMRGSEFIVAINKDPAAAIFQVADICIVEDLITFIPILIETFQKIRDAN
jgi:electron transfer flavoprotein alpha subunit